MTLAIETSRSQYTGDGSGLDYDYCFRIDDETHLKVTVRDPLGVETSLVLNTDFTVTNVGEDDGGNITLLAASQEWIDVNGMFALNFILDIRRVRPLTQDTDLRNQSSYFPDVVEAAMDSIVEMAQQLQDEFGRSIQMPETYQSSDFDSQFPSPIVPNGILGVTADGTALCFPLTVPALNNAVTSCGNSAAAAAGSATSAVASANVAATEEAAAAASAASAAASAAAAAASAGVSTGTVRPIKTITHAMSPYPVNPATDADLILDTSAGNVQIIAPSASANDEYGFRAKWPKGSANAASVTSADDIDGSATFNYPTPGRAYEFKTDGSTFYVF